MSLIRSTATIGGYTFLSRIFGFSRDMLQASVIGANVYSDVFFVAFKLPNFFRRIFAEGAFNAAFVPLFAGALAEEGRDAARLFAQQAMALLLVALIALTALLITIMPWFMYLLAPGFASDPAKFDLAITLTRITFPYLLFISLVTLLGAILNSLERFAAVAFTPVLMNICFIASLLVVWRLNPPPEMGVRILAVGVTISGFVQLVWLAMFCRKVGMLPRLVRPRITPQMRKLFTVMLPAVIGGSVAQINLMVDTIIASFLPRGGSISYLYYADRINELPLAVIGIAVSTALLPMLSRQIRTGDIAAATHSQNRAIELTALLALPAAAALMLLAEPILSALFQRGNFTSADTTATARALIVYAAGLPAFVLAKILTPGFYARHDTRTPFIIATVCIGLNFVLNILFIMYTPLAHVGMALATTIAGWVNAAMLGVVLHRRGLFKTDAQLALRIPRILLCSGLMSLALWGATPYLQPWFSGGDLIRFSALMLLVITGMAVYGTSVLLFRATDTTRLKTYLRRRAQPVSQDMTDEQG